MSGSINGRMLFPDHSIEDWCLWLRTTCTIYGLLQNSYMCRSLIVMSLITRSLTQQERYFGRPWYEKSCTCKVWDYEKFPCLQGLAAYIYFTENVDGSRLNIHALCSKYYWTELWDLAYSRTLYVVPDMYSWNVPDQIKEVKFIPPAPITRKGRKRVKTT